MKKLNFHMNSTFALLLLLKGIICTTIEAERTHFNLIKSELKNCCAKKLIFYSNNSHIFYKNYVHKFFSPNRIQKDDFEKKTYPILKYYISMVIDISENLETKLKNFNSFVSQNNLELSKIDGGKRLFECLDILQSEIVILKENSGKLINENYDSDNTKIMDQQLYKLNHVKVKEFFLKTISLRKKFLEFQIYYNSLVWKIEISKKYQPENLNKCDVYFFINDIKANIEGSMKRRTKKLHNLYSLERKMFRERKYNPIIKNNVYFEYKTLEYIYNYMFGENHEDSFFRKLVSGSDSREIKAQIKEALQVKDYNFHLVLNQIPRIIMHSIRKTLEVFEKKILEYKKVKLQIFVKILQMLEAKKFSLQKEILTKDKLIYYKLRIVNELKDLNMRLTKLQVSIYFKCFIKIKLINENLKNSNYKNIIVLDVLNENISYFRNELIGLGIICEKNNEFLEDFFENTVLNILFNEELDEFL